MKRQHIRHMSPKHPDALRIVAVNAQDGLAPVEIVGPRRARHVRKYLGRVAALSPDMVFVSEAMRRGGDLALDVLRLFPGYGIYQIDNNDQDGRQDAHRDLLLYRPEALDGLREVRLAGRTALVAYSHANGLPVIGAFSHAYDRPAPTRHQQAVEELELLSSTYNAFTAGDRNTISYDAPHARLLRSRPVRFIANHAYVVHPGEKPDPVRLPGVVGTLATKFMAGVGRVGSLIERTSYMAEAPGFGPLQTLRRAGFQEVDTTHQITRSFIGPIGLQLDHGLQRGMVIEGFSVIPARGASDHDGVVMDLRPLQAADGTDPSQS